MAGKVINEVIKLKSARDTDIYTGVMVPALERNEKAPLVILAHGFMGNKDENGLFSGGVFDMPGAADQLLTLGIASVRIDFPGTGDSAESFENYTMDNMLGDLDVVYRHMLENDSVDPGRVAILGWSMGGKVAALFVDNHPEIGTMLLWAPAAGNGTDDLDKALSSFGTDLQATAMRDGKALMNSPFPDKTFYISKEFFTSLDGCKPMESINNYKGNKMFIYGTADSAIPARIYQDLISKTDIGYLSVEGADHDFGADGTNNPVQAKTLFDTTISYLYKHLMA